MFGIFAIFVIRLAQIQILQGGNYAKQANNMQMSKEVINPTRGEIFVRDADGNLAPLVLNQTVYTLFADPTQITDVAKVKDLVNSSVGNLALTDNFAKLTDKSTQYVVLAKNVTYDQAQTIQKANLAGLGLQAGSQRVYPEGALAAQVLGYVNSDGKGQYGVEQSLNTRLTGTPGQLNTVTDVRRIPLTIGTHDTSVPAKNGENVVLSLDRNVQLQAEQDLAAGLVNSKATSGSIIVMDPETGRVLAMASNPSYDPANLNSIVINKNQDVSTASALPATNAYEPGSIMKFFTITAAINGGFITPNSTFANSDCIQVLDAKICNVDKGLNGPKTPMQILEFSLNTGATWALESMGGGSRPPSMAAQQFYYNFLNNNYHFAKPTGIEVAGEADSVIYSPESLADKGGALTYANMSFGQGMQLTMVQVMAAFSAVINGGNYYQPTVVLGTTDQAGGSLTEQQPKLVQAGAVSAQDSQDMVAMLQQARYLGAPGAKTTDNGFFCGGKSGTAQKVDPATGKYSDTLTTGSYIGFCAGADHKPKYAILVRIDDAHNGGYSGSAAAQPIFDKMSQFMNTYEGMSK
jgi:cell division protein FtsI/penicillin-binding protein 2